MLLTLEKTVLTPDLTISVSPLSKNDCMRLKSPKQFRNLLLLSIFVGGTFYTEHAIHFLDWQVDD